MSLGRVLAKRRIWASSHVGLVRSINEDRCLAGYWRSDGNVDEWMGEFPEDRGWAAVIDGMGGHAAGAAASRIVLEAVANRIPAVTNPQGVVDMLEAANLSLFEAMYSAEGGPAMGATIVGAVWRGHSGLVFNVGDSRAYRFDRQGLSQVSRDDSLRGPGKTGRRPRHMVTQSLGGTLRRTPLAPHILSISLEDDCGLLLCSDGLTDMIADDEIFGVLARNPTNPAERLVAAALDAGGRDNVSVLIVGSAAALWVA